MISIYAKKVEEVKTKPKFKLFLGNVGKKKIYLRPIGKNDLQDKKLISNLAKWRRKYQIWFPGQFKVTLKGTKVWLDKLVISNPDRILFMIEDDSKNQYGHLGFYRYSAQDKSCELDNVIRGSAQIPGLMTTACRKLTTWGFANLGIKKLYLTVFADNEKAIGLYERCGFCEIERIPLEKVVKDNGVYWEETKEKSKAQRYNLRMVYGKN